MTFWESVNANWDKIFQVLSSDVIAVTIFCSVIVALFMANQIPEKSKEELLKPRTIFAFMFYGTFLWLILNKMDVPPALNTIVSGLFGYWFGSRKANGNGQNGGAK